MRRFLVFAVLSALSSPLPALADVRVIQNNSNTESLPQALDHLPDMTPQRKASILNAYIQGQELQAWQAQSYVRQLNSLSPAPYPFAFNRSYFPPQQANPYWPTNSYNGY